MPGAMAAWRHDRLIMYVGIYTVPARSCRGRAGNQAGGTASFHSKRYFLDLCSAPDYPLP